MTFRPQLFFVVAVMACLLGTACSQRKGQHETRLEPSIEKAWQLKFDSIRLVEVSDQKRALDLCFELQSVVAASHSDTWIIKLKIQEARLYFYAGLIEKSTSCYLETLELLKTESQGSLNYLDAHIGLGAILHAIGNHEAALPHLFKAYAALDSSTDYYVKSYSSIINNVGSAYISLEKYQQADSVMQVGIAFLLREDATNGNLKRLYNNMAKLNKQLGNYDQALEYLRKVQAWELEGSGIYTLVLSYLFEAELHVSRQDSSQAKNAYLLAYHLADSFSLPVPLADAAFALSSFYQQSGKSDSVIFYTTVYQAAVADSKASEAAQKIAAKAIQDYYEEKSQSLERNKTSSMRLTWLVVLSTLLSLLVLGLLLYRFKSSLNNLRMKKLEQTILYEKIEEQYKEEATTFSELSELDQQQRLLEQSGNLIYQDLLLKIDLLSQKYGETESKMIQKALPKENLQTWAKKLNEFEQAYMADKSDFLNRLSERFPGLTIQERRLCVFFGQGMSNAEVAALTKKSVPTILTAKSRLRTSLGITKTGITLEEFLRAL